MIFGRALEYVGSVNRKLADTKGRSLISFEKACAISGVFSVRLSYLSIRIMLRYDSNYVVERFSKVTKRLLWFTKPGCIRPVACCDQGGLLPRKLP